MINFLDIRTLTLVLGATLLITGISMLCYAFNRKIYGSFRLWTMAVLGGAVGFLLISLRHLLPDLITIIFANTLFFFSFSLLYLGFKLIGKPYVKPHVHLASMACLSFIVYPFLTYIHPSINARISLFSFTAAIYFTLDTRVLVTEAPMGHIKNNILLIISLVLLTIVLTLRGIFYLYPENRIECYMENNPFQGIFLITITMLFLSLIMGLMQLNSQILEQELCREQIRLKKSEEKYRQLVEGSRQGLIIARDNPIEFCFVSNSMESILGYTGTELRSFSSRHLPQLIHPDDREKLLRNFSARLSGERFPSIQQYRILHKTQGTRWVETHTSCIEYEGQPAVHAHCLDITQRKQAEAINAALFAISNAVNTTPDLNALYRSIHTSLGTIIDVTNFFIALVDLDAHCLYFPYFVDTQDKDFPPIRNFSLKNSLTGLVISREAPILLDEKMLKKREAEKEIQGSAPLIWMGVPLISKKKVIGVVAVQSYTDPNLYNEKDLEILSAVSHQIAIAIERKQAEDAVLESEKKYRHLFETAPAGIYEIDFEKQKFVNVNEIICQYSGYTEKEFLNLNPFDLLDEESQKKFAARLEAVAAGKTISKTVEFKVVKKNGEKLTVLLSCDFIHEGKRLKGAIVVVHDITERKKMETEKIEAQKLAAEQTKLALIGQIAGKMSHDFNNILGIIMGNIELLLLDCEDPAMEKILKMILNQTIRGKNITRNLVAFARNQEPRQIFFNINKKIDLVLELMKKDLEGIRLTKQYEYPMPDLLADPGMVEHALVNLLQNAIHALGKTSQPTITLTTHHENDTICFEITDNGCGIPKEYLDKIYDPAFTLKGSNDTRGAYHSDVKGTGYGMGNVQKYIHQHRGTIDVQSRINAGTTVRITFPVIAKQLTAHEKKEISQVSLHRGKRILLVEDEQDISDVQYRLLTQYPCYHKVDVAPNGEIAMDLFDNVSYDLVSLDYMLPGAHNGMEVYHHIRQKNKTIPVLFVSGNIEFLESIKILKEKDRRVEHLSKPCGNKTYVQSIDTLLAQGEGYAAVLDSYL